MMNDTEDLVDFLLSNGSDYFSRLTYEEKCNFKTKRPTPNLHIEIQDGKQKRRFQMSWYKKFTWLTGSSERKKMYCYICLLFGGDLEWSSNGIATIKNFDHKAQKHKSSKKHLHNSECYHLLGRQRIEHALSEGARLSALKFNEKVSFNRKIVGRLVQAICFLSHQELAFRGHHEDQQSVNKGNYLELLDLLSQEEVFMREHLDSSSAFKGTSSDIQNELINIITQVVNERMRKEINACEFISVQADETLDVSCKSQMSIIFRYCYEDSIKERFIGFYDVSKDKNAEALSAIILKVLKDWDVDKKLISQTYDGASVMAGRQGGVQNLVRRQCPHAIFIHCYAHQLNLILLYGSKTIKLVRFFIYDLTAFHTFFSKSSKRTALLRDEGFKLPQASTTRWNFYSRATTTIKTHFNDLRVVLNHITERDENWDGDSVNSAIGLLQRLDNPTFVFLLCLYDKIFVYTDHLFNVLQAKCRSDVKLCNNEIRQTMANIKNLRNDETVVSCQEDSVKLNKELDFNEGIIERLKILMFEVIDSILVQLDIRFGDFEHLDFVELLNEKSFKVYAEHFPTAKVLKLMKVYPFFDQQQLINELTLIYSDSTKHTPPQDLLKFIVGNELQLIYEQVTKLIHIILTIPVTTASSERSMSTLKRIKTHLRNAMTDNRLTKLSTLAIEKNLVKELSSDISFQERVIDVFAEAKNRRLELIYKKV